MLDAGPAACGWDEDQCWTLARIAELVCRRFGAGYTLAGLDLLLHRIGWSVQVPARAAGRLGHRRTFAGRIGNRLRQELASKLYRRSGSGCVSQSAVLDSSRGLR